MISPKKRAARLTTIGVLIALAALICIGIFYGTWLAILIYIAIVGANMEQRGKFITLIENAFARFGGGKQP